MKITNKEALGIIRGINVVCALLMIGLGVFKFIYTPSMTLRVAVWTFYWILFGVFIIIAECRVKFVLNYFAFLDGGCGKGLFIIFCGTCLINNLYGDTMHESVLGIIMCVAGIFTIFLSVATGSDKPQQTQYAAPPQAQA